MSNTTNNTTSTSLGNSIAIEQGYFVAVHIENDYGDTLDLLVKPDADLDGRFKAWDMDNQEWLMVDGWLWACI